MSTNSINLENLEEIKKMWTKPLTLRKALKSPNLGVKKVLVQSL
ncbi:hypothetical protein GCM10020331_073970 [Ectobacillus funiculus]